MKRFISPFLIILLLGTLAAGLMGAPSGGKVAVDPQQVRHELKDILANPEYNQVFKKGAMQLVWEKILKAIAWFLDLLFRIPRFGLAGGSRIASLVFAGLVVAGFAILVFLIIRWLSGRVRAEEFGDDPDADNYELPSARPLVKQAAKLAEVGDYHGAFRCAYLASISYLDEIQALRFERSRTNWEYLRDLKQGGHEIPYKALRPLTLDFDRKFYGREGCEIRDYQNALSVYESICREAAS